MLWMASISEGLQEMVVSTFSTTILGRCRTLSLQADRMLQFLFRLEDLLHQDRVTPAISKVIFINELELLPGYDSIQPELFLVLEIIAKHISFPGDDAVALTIYQELVQMAVIPAHDLLQDLV